MAKKKTILDLLDDLEGDVKSAFIESIARVTSQLDFDRLVDAISKNDTSTVIEMFGISKKHFDPIDRAMRDAYETGGTWFAEELQRMASTQGIAINAYFTSTNQEAVSWLLNESSRRIADISDGTRRAIRNHLAKAAEVGTSPRRIALDLAGRFDIKSKRRIGGIIGLTDKQNKWAVSALEELTDVKKMRKYLKRKLRNRNFDSIVKAAIKSGKPLDANTAGKIVSSYRSRILAHRAEAIARTELHGALHKAQNDSLLQTMQEEGIYEEEVERTWDASEDGDTRDDHASADGQKRRANEPFVVGGYNMMHPGDSSLGAPASQIINCRCIIRTIINFLPSAKRKIDRERLAA